jgi:hypothetical protein
MPKYGLISEDLARTTQPYILGGYARSFDQRVDHALRSVSRRGRSRVGACCRAACLARKVGGAALLVTELRRQAFGGLRRSSSRLWRSGL